MVSRQSTESRMQTSVIAAWKNTADPPPKLVGAAANAMAPAPLSVMKELLTSTRRALSRSTIST